MAAIHLVRGKSLYLGDLFRLFAAEAPQWLSLKEPVVTGRSDPKHGPVDIGPRRFTMAMHALALLGEAAALAEAVDLSGRRDLIDIGCGSGAYSVEFCRRNPDLRATLLDRPQVLEVAEKIVAANGMAERIETQRGDMLGDSYGENRDAALMSDVIYLGSKSSKRMLRSAHRALVSGGLLVIRATSPILVATRTRLAPSLTSPASSGVTSARPCPCLACSNGWLRRASRGSGRFRSPNEAHVSSPMRDPRPTGRGHPPPCPRIGLGGGRDPMRTPDDE